MAGDGLYRILLEGAFAGLLLVGRDAHARIAVEFDREEVGACVFLHLDRDGQIIGDPGQTIAVDDTGLDGLPEILKGAFRHGADAFELIAGLELDGEIDLALAEAVDLAVFAVAGIGCLHVVRGLAVEILRFVDADGYALVTFEPDIQKPLSAFGAYAVLKMMRQGIHLVGNVGFTALGAGVGGVAPGCAGGERDLGGIAVLTAGGEAGDCGNQGDQYAQAKQHTEQTVFHMVPFLISVIPVSCEI